MLDIIKKKIQSYPPDAILFTKVKLIDWLCHRNACSIDDFKDDLLSLKNMVYVERQVVEYAGEQEERFRCYFVYSKNKGRCYILKFDSNIKVITVFPLGRTTLRRYKKRFK